jgi:hypothetical protein
MCLILLWGPGLGLFRGSRRFPRDGEDLKASWRTRLRTTQLCFCRILLAKDPRGGDTDSIFWLEELQSHIAKEDG